ncbi:MAG: TrkA family potassium uptake protein [Sporomusaceae bacterium]|nr:TrkA family potassium uptake protein [Sporomusaceae bacterium]
MKKKHYAVIGLGRFGIGVATTLAAAGYEVLVIDSEEERIQKISELFTHAVVADTTDEAALKSLGIRNFDIVIVAIGHNIEASVMTVLLLKELGAPYIVAKADSAIHGKMLEKVGADRVVFPERDMGQRIAHNLVSTNVIDYFEVAPDLGIIEVAVPENLINSNLIEADLRSRYKITIIAIRRGAEMLLSPDPNEAFLQGDGLILVGDSSGIQRFESEYF